MLKRVLKVSSFLMFTVSLIMHTNIQCTGNLSRFSKIKHIFVFTQHIIWLSDNLTALIFTAVTLWWTLLSIKWVQTYSSKMRSNSTSITFWIIMYIYMYIAIYTFQYHVKDFSTSMTILGFDVETIFKQEAHAPHRSPEQITLFNFQRTSEKTGI